ncbi:MAG: Crp/Fnr family transcriptional regulator [bacterium]
MDLKEKLARTQLCAELAPGELAQIAAIVRVGHLAKGELLFLEGDPAEGFYLLLTGGVRLYKASAEGREQTLHLVRPGQSFADAAIFRGGRFPANCIATRDSEVAFLPSREFLKILSESPAISLKMIGSLAGYLREFIQMIEDLSLREVSVRLAAYLLNLHQASKSKTFRLPTTKTELARKLGTVSETLSRNLHKLKEKSLIDVSGRQITILDPDALAELAHPKQN